MAQNKGRKPIPLGGLPAEAPRKHTPFPSIIDGNPWEVKEGRWPSFIDRSKIESQGGVMQVPLGSEEVDRKLRLHEQAHVAWTPKEADKAENNYGVHPKTLGACEDARLIELMNGRNPEWERINKSTDLIPPYLLQKHTADFAALAEKLARANEGDDEEGILPPVKTMTMLEAAQLVAASRGQYEAQHFDNLCAQYGLDFIPEKVSELHNKWLGEGMFARVKRKVKGEKKPEPAFEDAVSYAMELEQFFQELEDQMEEEAGELEDADMPPMPWIPPLTDDEARWGDMRIEEAPLTERLKGDPSRKVRATDMGAVPRYMHRLVSDQRVFGKRRKQQIFQGTVLIDLSGSMSLTPQEVDEILQRWPAVTIATYSGNDADGVMRIVAKNGRRAHTGWLGPPAGSNNMVDGPALDWLCRQKGPRVWISDGGVTGLGGHGRNLVLDAARKCNRGRVKRIENVQELIRG